MNNRMNIVIEGEKDSLNCPLSSSITISPIPISK